MTVQTTPASLTFTVDGTNAVSTRRFSWMSGSSHTIATTSPQSGGTGVQYVWTNWTGGGAISHTVVPTTNKTYTANFTTHYYLTMAHGTGGTVTPASGWKNSGATVSITVRPASGYSFSSWAGTGTRFLFRYHQSCFNHNGRPHHGSSYFYSELICPSAHRRVEERQAAVAELKHGMGPLVPNTKEQTSRIRNVSAWVELTKPAPQVVDNS